MWIWTIAIFAGYILSIEKNKYVILEITYKYILSIEKNHKYVILEIGINFIRKEKDEIKWTILWINTLLKMIQHIQPLLTCFVSKHI